MLLGDLNPKLSGALHSTSFWMSKITSKSWILRHRIYSTWETRFDLSNAHSHCHHDLDCQIDSDYVGCVTEMTQRQGTTSVLCWWFHFRWAQSKCDVQNETWSKNERWKKKTIWYNEQTHGRKWEKDKEWTQTEGTKNQMHTNTIPILLSHSWNYFYY